MTDEEFTNELKRLRPGVAAYCKSLCRDHEDLAQDSLLRAWASREQVHTNMAAWLRRVVFSTFMNTRSKAPKHVSFDELTEPLRDTLDLEKLAEDRDTIRRALNTEGVKDCLGFLVAGGVGTNEYADKIGVKRKTFRTRVYRMRQKLAEVLK